MGRSLSSGSAMEALAALGVWSAHEHLSLRRMGLTAVFSAELEVCKSSRAWFAGRLPTW